MKGLGSLLLIVLLAASVSFSQISLTKDDITSHYALGSMYVTNFKVHQGTVNVGNKGGGNTWDFSGLVSEGTFSATVVDPSTTPYTSDFPGATLATYSQSNNTGVISESYSYFTLNGSFDHLGSVSSTDFQGFTSLTITTYSPAQLAHPVPLNYNDSFTGYSQMTSNIQQTGLPPRQTTGSTALSAVVDAYGTLIVPGGSSHSALRMRQIHTDTSITQSGTFTGTSTAFIFITKEGASVSVTDSGATTAEEGTITINGGIAWSAAGVVSVDDELTRPVEFSLDQNYPNPFNPSTLISYSIPERSHVRLSAYDLLGREVVQLVNQVQGAGNYRVTFDASGLPSGTYLYRITAGDFTSVNKMTFMR
jgi:hypothetical protein